MKVLCCEKKQEREEGPSVEMMDREKKRCSVVKEDELGFPELLGSTPRSREKDNEERFAGAERREREASMCVCVREREVINKNQGYYWTLFFSVLPILPLSTRSTPTVKLPRNI